MECAHRQRIPCLAWIVDRLCVASGKVVDIGIADISGSYHE
jgi:hypothetical protein